MFFQVIIVEILLDMYKIFGVRLYSQTLYIGYDKNTSQCDLMMDIIG